VQPSHLMSRVNGGTQTGNARVAGAYRRCYAASGRIPSGFGRGRMGSIGRTVPPSDPSFGRRGPGDCGIARTWPPPRCGPGSPLIPRAYWNARLMPDTQTVSGIWRYYRDILNPKHASTAKPFQSAAIQASNRHYSPRLRCDLYGIGRRDRSRPPPQTAAQLHPTELPMYGFMCSVTIPRIGYSMA
jgi:hypothetical protein